ncbi:MAG: tryptophan-rich sensory protein [Patescibacteria group bacterium]|nr:tryptophan-rich sensory protein [Patescibacteria group bacterium]
MNLKNWLKLILAIAISESAGVVGIIFTVSAIPNWYADLIKSSLTPPNWLFGPVWTLLYVVMGVAAFLIWRKGLKHRAVKIALGVFIGQLVLNAGWSAIFFGLHEPLFSLIEIIILWLSIIATIILFYRISKPAAYLLIPYILWVAFAAYLNYAVWALNPSGAPAVPEAVYCAQDVQSCPDGSYVHRVPPSCDFAACSTDSSIKLDSPQAGAQVSSPLTIKGEAKGNWFFEAVFPVKLYSANGTLLAQGQARAQSDWMAPGLIHFEASLSFTVASMEQGKLVLMNDNPSGLKENSREETIPLTLMPAMRTVSLFYYNPSLDTDASGTVMCSSAGLVPVSRQIPITQTPIQDTIKLLLQGDLTQQERVQGITTEFPLPGVSLQGASLNKQTGVLTLSFNDPNSATGGGSCRVAVLWAEIRATAKQFSGVKQVIFSPEYLFQP